MTDDRGDDAVRHFSGYAKRFHAYYGQRAEFEERLSLWHDLIDRYNVPGGFALDLGCGSGVLTFHLAQKSARVVGVDAADGMVTLCEEQRKERGIDNVRFMTGRLPLIDEAGLTNADLVISSSVVEYVEDLQGCLRLFARLLKPGAALIVSMPNMLSVSRMYERLKYRLVGEPKIYRHIRHFSSPSLLQRHSRPFGLTLQEAHYFTHFTRAAKLARSLGLPPFLTEDLFVAVFRNTGQA
jgi:2-polyprenyl-3-methyl-5-hydroxy-6-metoxy-1,4-benzoquinol methylase